MQKLLFVDDDADLLQSNEKYFTKMGYLVKTATTPHVALSLLESYRPDCILLDVMLPQMDGFQLLQALRTLCPAPVIYLSGRTGEDSKIAGLAAGGNDYVVKPYSLRELDARIQVQIRNSAAAPQPHLIHLPPLTLDITAHKAYYNNDTEIPLSNKEYALLHLLATTPSRVFTFQEIGAAVWGGYVNDSDRRTIMVTASRLRKKLEGYPALETAIETVRSKGYRFISNRR